MKQSKIALAALIFTTLIITLVYRPKHWGKAALSTESINPSEAVYSISGYAKETILLTPNLEPNFRATNFTTPLKSYGLELLPGNKASKINLDIPLPITIEKSDSKYLYSYISQESGLYTVKYADKVIKGSEYLDFHDYVVHKDGTFTFMEYIPDLKDRSMHLGLKRIDSQNRVLWFWDSRSHITKEHFVKFSDSINENAAIKEKLPLFEALRRIRKQYSTFALNILGTDIFNWLADIKLHLPNRTYRLFDRYIHLVDHIHANSIQYLENEKYILVSARHLDALFIIEVSTGQIVWSLGGPYSTFSKNRVVGDPRGGFSHQHDAVVYKDRLYLFDNANMFSDFPSRAVVYTFDMKNPNNCRFLYEYLEPSKRRRLSMGSIQPLDEDRILIGWGGVPLYDRDLPSAAASIVSMKDKKNEWQVDFRPSWTSYRVRAYQ
jgi:hypothetical protein